MKYEDKLDVLTEYNEEAIVFHDIEDALVGWVVRMGSPTVALYSADKAIEALIDEETDYESAVEWFEYNTLNTWAGDNTPAFVYFFDEEETKCQSCLARENGWWRRIVTKIMAIRKYFGA